MPDCRCAPAKEFLMSTTPSSPLPSTIPAGLRVGCIGCGAMGGALLSGLIGHGLVLSGYNRTPARLDPLKALGVTPRETIADLVRQADVILLGVKPAGVLPALREGLEELTADKVVVSIAAGVPMSALLDAVAGRAAVARCMPNTPARVGSGIFALCLEDPCLGKERGQTIIDLFSILGVSIPLPEYRFSAFTALVGCGPAYVFHFMDALAEAGVTLGFSRREAIHLVKELVLGSARLASETGEHPALLREEVCSPAGTTIAAINHMDRTALRGHIIDAVLAAYQREERGR